MMKLITHICKHCNKEFTKVGGYKTHGIYGFVCDECRRKYKNNNKRLNNYKRGRQKPMTDNPSCSAYRGCYRAENFVFDYYGIDQIMPYGHHGYDCVYNGSKLEIKSSTPYIRGKGRNWQFAIRENKIADIFVLVAYDDKSSTIPSHIWELPASLVNNKQCLSIACNPKNRTRFDIYEKPLTNILKYY